MGPDLVKWDIETAPVSSELSGAETTNALGEVVAVIEATPEQPEPARPYLMRQPCRYCPEQEQGVATRVNGQYVVRCAACGKYNYNAPRTETGEQQRSVQTVHKAIKPKTRFKVLVRASRRCELCGKPITSTTDGLHVDHLLSVDDGLAMGLTEAQLNDIESLAALCEECNLGKGRTTLPLHLALAIIKARTVGGDGDQ